MLAVDTNILIHAYYSDSELHDAAAAAVRVAAEAEAAWAIPWPCIHEFFGVVTSNRLPRSPRRAELALKQINAWMQSPSLQLLTETRNHWRTLERLISAGQVTGGLIHDAKIAALCLDNGVSELLTLDRDFSRFPELKVRSILP